jgi:hypothetical protein
MPRDCKVSLEDILEAVSRIETYTLGMDRDQFQADIKTIDAVVRNLETIGEATKNIPPEVRAAAPGVPWSNGGNQCQSILPSGDYMYRHHFLAEGNAETSGARR